MEIFRERKVFLNQLKVSGKFFFHKNYELKKAIGKSKDSIGCRFNSKRETICHSPTDFPHWISIIFLEIRLS